jgi:hypothetical protein
MDRDGVDAEVLYSEVSAFRAFGLVKGDWKPISRAFTDLMAEFASVDPKRLVVSYQVPIIDIDYAVSEVLRLADLGARSVHLPNFPSEIGLPEYEPRRPRAHSETGIPSTPSGNRHWLYDVTAATRHRRWASSPHCRRCVGRVFAWWILTGTSNGFPD